MKSMFNLRRNHWYRRAYDAWKAFGRVSGRTTLCAMLGLATVATPAQKPMPKDAKPVFEVVTVKPTPPEERNQGFQTQGSHIKLVRQTVQSMLMFAYGVHGKQIVDAPDWVQSEAFNVDGIPDVAGDPNLPQFQSLVKQLLADRFGVRVHSTQRELSYYALRVAPGGLKIARSTAPEDASPDQTGNGGSKGQTMKYTNNSMDEFLVGLRYFTDRPLVNETALAGRYDFTLQWTPDQMKTPEGEAAPGLFTAMREQLGLELKPAKGPVEVLAVDAVQKPGAN